jgi:hypothetical protein
MEFFPILILIFLCISYKNNTLCIKNPNFCACDIVGNWDSSVSTVTRLQVVSRRNCYWMSNNERFISPSLCLTGSVDPLNLIFSGYSSHSHGVKAAAVWSWPLIAICCWGENECSFTVTLSYTFVVAKCNCTFLHLMWYSWTQQVG